MQMTSNEVLSMYENIAGLTAKMAVAAQAHDWASLAKLEGECKSQSTAAETGVPALTGELRKRKIDLIKQIMANDRAIREVTEPWQSQLEVAMAH
jgi:flagellar protein FliT